MATDSVFQLLIVSLVMPCLDYVSAILAGLSTSQLHRLQSMHNTAARLTHPPWYDEHVTPMLQYFHWLRSLEGIDFRLAVLLYRCLHAWSGAMVSFRPHPARRWFQPPPPPVVVIHSMQLVIQRTRLSTVGECAFLVAGCRLWNSLPPNVTSAPMLTVFRNRLKTSLFPIISFITVNCFLFLFPTLWAVVV